MKLMYLTWGETPRGYGVFSSQAISQFREVSKALEVTEAIFISAVPIINSGITRDRFRYNRELARVKELLGTVDFKLLPLLLPQNFFNSSRHWFRAFQLGARHRFNNIVKRFDPDIVHCRSYHAAFAAINLREKHGYSYKVVFDPRGLYPEEVAFKKRWQEESKDFRYLKGIEKYLLGRADCVISVSPTMTSHYAELTSTPIRDVYLGVNLDSISQVHDQILSKNDLHQHEPKQLLYIGALDSSSWHSPEQLKQLYREFAKCFSSTSLLIITNSNHDYIKLILSEFSAEEIIIRSAKSFEEITLLANGSDFGALPYRKVANEYERNIGLTMLGTKTVEYLALGLPVICNQDAAGAASIIEANSAGLNYDSSNISRAVNASSLKKVLASADARRLRKIASEQFSHICNVAKVLSIYKHLI